MSNPMLQIEKEVAKQMAAEGRKVGNCRDCKGEGWFLPEANVCPGCLSDRRIEDKNDPCIGEFPSDVNITGLDFGYEQYTQSLVRAALWWMAARRDHIKNWYGSSWSDIIYKDPQGAEFHSFMDQMGREASGYQVKAAISHATFIHFNGWHHYLNHMRNNFPRVKLYPER